MVQMLSYLYHNIISQRETYPEVLVKIRHDDVILRHVTYFSYIFPIYDVINKNADVSKTDDVMAKVMVGRYVGR